MLLPGALNLEVLGQRHGSKHVTTLAVVRYGGSEERGYMMLLDSWDKDTEVSLGRVNSVCVTVGDFCPNYACL